MSSKRVCLAALSVLASLSTPAFAQDRGYGYPGADYYADPGNGGGSAYEPFFYPDQRDQANRRGYGDGGDQRPQPYDQSYGSGYDQGPAQPLYVDPYGGRDERSGGGYDLGPNATRTTREEVVNTTRQPPGTIVIDTATRHLYFTEPNGQALQYGIGVGREGFAWKGVAKVERKAEWPDWIPPADMLKRRPDLPLRMEGGIENPLGARALYLFKGNRDTLFRIHGTNEPDTIGKAVSSGCIRMMNADVIDLYQRVPVGTKVVVL